MENSTDITQIILDTINSIFEKLFSSIDNSLYSTLDKIVFIDSSILDDKNFEKILGTSTTDGILIIANSLLLGFILYYAIKYMLSHITYKPVEHPFSFFIKLIIFRYFYELFFFYNKNNTWSKFKYYAFNSKLGWRYI